MDRDGFEGRIAIVTGGAQGIGEAVVRTLCKLGVFVAAIDQKEEELNQLIEDLESQGQRARAFTANIGESHAVNQIVQVVEEEIGPIDILVNVAGVLRVNPVESLTDEDWTTCFSVNSTGVFYVSRAVSKRMIPRKSGSIVTVGSNAAGVSRMNMSAYASSKAAATLFTKCLGLELAQYNIRCNVVSPGSTDTEMQRSLWSNENGAENVIEGALDSYRVGIPLNKIATPIEIADAVVFMLSDQARHITMHNLCVDGGATLGV